MMHACMHACMFGEDKALSTAETAYMREGATWCKKLYISKLGQTPALSSRRAVRASHAYRGEQAPEKTSLQQPTRRRYRAAEQRVIRWTLYF